MNCEIDAYEEKKLSCKYWNDAESKLSKKSKLTESRELGLKNWWNKQKIGLCSCEIM